GVDALKGSTGGTRVKSEATADNWLSAPRLRSRTFDPPTPQAVGRSRPAGAMGFGAGRRGCSDPSRGCGRLALPGRDARRLVAGQGSQLVRARAVAVRAALGPMGAQSITREN